MRKHTESARRTVIVNSVATRQSMTSNEVVETERMQPLRFDSSEMKSGSRALPPVEVNMKVFKLHEVVSDKLQKMPSSFMDKPGALHAICSSQDSDGDDDYGSKERHAASKDNKMDSMRNVMTRGHLSLAGSPHPSKPISIVERAANVDLPMDDHGSEDTKKLNQHGSNILSN